jgi:hypothetical protein
LGIGFGMARTRDEFAPAMPIQEAVDAPEMNSMLYLSFKGVLDLLGSGNLSPLGSGDKRLEKGAFLLERHGLMASSPSSRCLQSGTPQAVGGGNDASHPRDRDSYLLSNLFGFAGSNQGMLNDPPALSNPKARFQFHTTFDFFKRNRSSGSRHSPSHNGSSSLSTLFPLLYHLERELV